MTYLHIHIYILYNEYAINPINRYNEEFGKRQKADERYRSIRDYSDKQKTNISDLQTTVKG
jgi:hypothetical protein